VKTIKVDVSSSRQRAETSKNSSQRENSGRSFYRLNVVPIFMPALRSGKKTSAACGIFQKNLILKTTKSFADSEALKILRLQLAGKCQGA
jgi:transcriptional regulator with GAF, ATPase, and Fis domain